MAETEGEPAVDFEHLPKLADAGLVAIAECDGEKRLRFAETPEMEALLSDLSKLEEA